MKEREAIFVKGKGLLVANVDDDVGIAFDDERQCYVRITIDVDTVNWLTEADYLARMEKPGEFSVNQRQGGIRVDYGVRKDDPNKDLIHTFDFQGGAVFQYQVDPADGMVRKVKVGTSKKIDILAPEGGRRYNGSPRSKRSGSI